MSLATDEYIYNQTISDDTVRNSSREANGSLVSVADAETWRALLWWPASEGIDN